MPGIDLSTLTAPELRQLLRLARGRRDGLLIDRVEWEIAQRKSLESRIGVDLKRSMPSLIEDGDVTIDEVRAFRRPEPGLPPPRRRGNGRLSAMLGGLVAGSALTAGAFASVGGGWRLPATIEIPALPTVAFAERPPAPNPITPPRPVVMAGASSDAVAGLLAPEPFPAPPPPPVEVVEPPPPAPIDMAEVAAPPTVETPKPKAEKPKADKPKLAAKKKPTETAKKTELAKKKPDAKAKTAVAAKTPSDKAKLAAKKDPKAKTAVAAKKKDPKAKTAVAAKKKDPRAKTAIAAKDTKAKKDASKTKLAAKDKPKAKVAAKPASKATAKAQAKSPAAKTALAKAPAKPAAKSPAKPKAQVAETAPQGEAQDAIGTLLDRTQGAAQ